MVLYFKPYNKQVQKYQRRNFITDFLTRTPQISLLVRNETQIAFYFFEELRTEN